MRTVVDLEVLELQGTVKEVTAIIVIEEELKAVFWRFGLPEFDFLAKVLLINLRKSASSDSFLDVISDGAF